MFLYFHGEQGDIVDLLDYSGQFVLARGSRQSIPGWSAHSFGSWFLQTHPSLPVIKMYFKRVMIGWLIGHVLSQDGSIVKESVQIEFDDSKEISFDEFEKWLYSFRGRFACAVFNNSIERFYLDPLGSLASVYVEDHPVIASTVGLVAAVSPDLIEPPGIPGEYSKGVPGFMQYYPAGLTGCIGCRRLLPNHYFDLYQWRAHRHWPVEPIHRVEQSGISDLLDAIKATLRTTIAAVLHQTQSYFGLTSGRDTRMQLASMTPEMRQHASFVTFDYQDGTPRTWADVHASKLIAMKLRLRHRILSVPFATDSQKSQYLQRIGWSGSSGKVRDFDLACRKNLDLQGSWVTGFGGEIARCPFCERMSEPNEKITGYELLNRMRLPHFDRFVESISYWQRELASEDPHLVNDLNYLENVAGCWATPHFYGTAPFTINLSAYADRQFIESCLRLPTDYRKRSGVAKDLSRLNLPTLESVGFNVPPIDDSTTPER